MSEQATPDPNAKAASDRDPKKEVEAAKRAEWIAFAKSGSRTNAYENGETVTDEAIADGSQSEPSDSDFSHYEWTKQGNYAGKEVLVEYSEYDEASIAEHGEGLMFITETTKDAEGRPINEVHYQLDDEKGVTVNTRVLPDENDFTTDPFELVNAVGERDRPANPDELQHLSDMVTSLGAQPNTQAPAPSNV